MCVYVYSGSPVSMAIHRVGKTLLIDEFSAPMAQVSASLDKLFEENMPQLVCVCVCVFV